VPWGQTVTTPAGEKVYSYSEGPMGMEPIAIDIRQNNQAEFSKSFRSLFETGTELFGIINIYCC
jgi:hypothetical protein